MATELYDRQNFNKNTAISKQIILLLQTEIWIMCANFGTSESI